MNTKTEVKFKVVFKNGEKIIELAKTPTYSMQGGLIAITEKDIDEYSLNQCKTDLIAGQTEYPYPDLAKDNFINKILIENHA